MKTKSIGEILREEREYHALTLSEVAAKTRIRLEYLEALELNSFEALPAAAFVKGYIKAYARLFGFDEQPVLALLRRDYKESAKGTLVPREFIKPVLNKRLLWTPMSWTMLLSAAVFAVLMLYVGFQWYSLNRPPTLTVAQPAEEAAVSAQIEVSGQTEQDASVRVNAQPVALQTDGSFKTTVFIPREGVSTITIEAVDRRGKINTIQRTVHVKF